MRTLKIMLLASATTFAAFQAAQAADAIYSAPEAPAAAESFSAPAGNWSGAYLGGAATYELGKFSGSNDGRDAKGLGGSVYGGYNMQSGSIVYGGEADLSYAGEDGSAGTQAGTGLTGTQGVNGSVRGRVGYDLNPFMVYGTAGVAVANHKLEGFGDNDEKLAAGYTVGAGVETFVTDNITARVEYRYSDYQKRDFDIGGSTVSKGFDDHSVKVGMGVKF